MGRTITPPPEDGQDPKISVQGRIPRPLGLAFRRYLYANSIMPGDALTEAITLWLSSHAPLSTEREMDPMHPVTPQGRYALLIACGWGSAEASDRAFRADVQDAGWARLLLHARLMSGKAEMMQWDEGQDGEVFRQLGLPFPALIGTSPATRA